MDLETTKHGPRLDDAMEHEVASLTSGAPVESRSREDRLQQDPVDVDMNAGARPDVQNLQLVDRSEIARLVAPAKFPATRDHLVEVATQEQAGEDVVTRLAALPEGEFANVQEVWENLPY